MKVLISVCLLAIIVYSGLVIMPHETAADGVYYANSGSWTIAIDTGSVSTDATRDSGLVPTNVPAYKLRSVIAKLKVGDSNEGITGWNNGDTAVLRLRTSLADGQVKTIDSIKALVPCSLLTRLVANDTLLWRDLFWTWKIADTCSELADSGLTVAVPWYCEAIVKE